MKPVVIFGNAGIAQLAHFYLTHDSDYEVAAFTVDQAYLTEPTFCGLPVVPFETVETVYPPSDYDCLVAVSYRKVNQLRAQKYREAKAKQYHLISYISSRVTRWPGLEVGDNCLILEDNTLQPFVKIGNNVILWSGNHIGHDVQIGDHCFISSHVVLSGGVKVGDSCFLGVNATVRDHVTIANNCVIAAGALILKDTQANQVYTAPGAELSKVPSHRLRGL